MRYGYFDTGEVAHEMVKEVLADFVFELKKYERFNKINVVEKYCVGIIRGLMKYDDESISDFKDYLDGVEMFIDDIYYYLENSESKINVDILKKKFECEILI